MFRPVHSHVARAGLLVLALACAPSFKISAFKTNDSLYRAGLRQLERKKWDNAIAVFEKLTLELPPRDTLLPRSHYYLARAHAGKGEHLLAAQSYSRLAETFPDDTLADDALLLQGREYGKMWRRPQLDAQYGETAIVTLRSLVELYPDSPLVPDANREVTRLLEWFAVKDYDSGMFYLRRKAYDSAIIYFKDVTRKYPTSAKARDAYLRLVDAYRAIHYRDDVKDVCATLHSTYPGDRAVVNACGAAPEKSVARPIP